MKKILSLALAAVMAISAVPMAYAADTNDYTAGTQVEYKATGTESYTITVPASLKPGQGGTVTLAGTWANNRVVTVTADSDVTLTNSILATDQKVLKVTFDGISEKGSNTAAQTFTEDVSVAGIENALFGIWSGKFNYNVETETVETVTTPLMFDEKYVLTFNSSQKTAIEYFIFYADGSAILSIDGSESSAPAGSCIYTESEIKILGTPEEYKTLISSDGVTITRMEDGDTLVYTLESAIQ